VWPVAAHAQQPERMRRIGVVMGTAESDTEAQALVGALRQGLQKLGWVEGRDIRIDVRFASADPNQIRTIAAELMSRTPDLIVSNTNLVTAVLQGEVRALPIIFISVGDPVGSGFVSNEARPTGNLTGFANWEMSMGGKWVGLLKEVAPQLKRSAPSPASYVSVPVSREGPSGGGYQPSPSKVKLSADELEIARASGISPVEYRRRVAL
jgi:ABC-type uncharacterized transport system substrate-binding protein